MLMIDYGELHLLTPFLLHGTVGPVLYFLTVHSHRSKGKTALSHEICVGTWDSRDPNPNAALYII